MKDNAMHCDKLREYLETVPLVDCHDHTVTCGPKYADSISVVVSGYFISYLQSASSGSDIAIMQDFNSSLEQRWPVLEKAWKRTCHTGYTQVTKFVMEKFYNEDELTLEILESGCHVIIEKPMGISADECRRMLKAAKKCGKHLIVAELDSFNLAAVLTGQKFKSDKLGAFLTGCIINSQFYFHESRPAWFLAPALSDGGMFSNVDLHLEPGYRKIGIDSHPCGLKTLSATLETPVGRIGGSVATQKRRIELSTSTSRNAFRASDRKA
jgi:hypothetical protein